MRAFGMVLIVLGILALVYQGFTYTKREKVVDLGPIQASADREKHVPIPPIAGAAAVVAGIVMVVADRRRGAPA